MKKKRNHVTRKMVNDALRVGGRNESLREGEGYFYFGGGEAVNWLSRFPKTREVGCFLGLRPGRRDSAKSQSQMRISKEETTSWRLTKHVRLLPVCVILQRTAVGSA